MKSAVSQPLHGLITVTDGLAPVATNNHMGKTRIGQSINLHKWSMLFAVPNNESFNSYNNLNSSSIQRFYRVVPHNQWSHIIT
jgi:hypothetical protein